VVSIVGAIRSIASSGSVVLTNSSGDLKFSVAGGHCTEGADSSISKKRPSSGQSSQIYPRSLMRGLRIRSGVLCSYATPGQSTAILEIGGRFLRNENWLPASSFAFGRTDSVLPRLERRKERQLGGISPPASQRSSRQIKCRPVS
jgi:hypothetical protein